MNLSYHAYEDKLNDEYAEAFSVIESYSFTKRVDEKLADEWLMELMDNMLTAQEAGKPVESIVGNDIDRFCREFYNRYSGSDIVIGIARKVYGLSAIIFFFSLIDGLLADEGESFFLGGTDIMPYLCGMLAGFILSEMILVVFIPLLRKRKISYKTYDKLKVWATIGYMVLVGVLCGILADRVELNVDRLVLIVISGGYCIIYNVIRAAINYRRYGTIREPKVEQVTMRDMVNANMETEFPKTLLKQYEKKNERLINKGKGELSDEDFMTGLSKKYSYKRQIITVVLSTLGGALIGVLIAACVLGASKTGAEPMFESFGDMIVFVLLILCVCTIISFMIIKLVKPSCNMFARIKEKCDEKGWTLAEYVESMEHNGNEDTVKDKGIL